MSELINLDTLDLTAGVNVQDLTEKLLAGQQADCPVEHEFIAGHYIRTVHLPKGAFVIGHYQRFAHINVFEKGKVMMISADGTKEIFEAPMTFIGPPGQKMGLILEDVTWKNIYVTDLTDVDDVEKTFLGRNDYFIELQAHKFAEQSLLAKADQDDFKAVLAELGITEDQIQAEMDAAGYISYLPPTVKKTISPIHGDGIFCTSNFNANEIIGYVLIGVNKTMLGRFINHSANPNCRFQDIGGEYMLVACRPIAGAQGGLLGEELTVDYRQTNRTTQERLCHQQ